VVVYRKREGEGGEGGSKHYNLLKLWQKLALMASRLRPGNISVDHADVCTRML
jgi:hypothetical protein